MALRPKLEFYTLRLVSKDLEYKTFRDFAIEELYQRRPSSDAQIMNKLFDHFMNGLVTDIAKGTRIKKQLKLIKTASNKHLDNRPVVDVQKNIIYGVINGGRFGRDGMMSDSSADAEEANAFGKNKTILRYYYFLLYLPLDHDEGCFILHSNSKEETITDMFKVYVERLFKGANFRRPALNMFCPKSFQREFQNEAIIKCIEFSNTYRDEVFTDEGIGTYHQLYDVKIEIKPKDGDISLTEKTKLGSLLRQLGFSRHKHNTEGLTSFDSKKMTLSSPFSKTDRTFDFDDENRARFKEIMLNAFSKAKYTVGNATKTGEGEYDVEVTIEPLKSGASDQEEFNNRVAAIDTTNMTEEEYTKAVYGVLLDLLEESVNNPVYGEPQTTTVHYGLLDKENKVYGVSEEDGNKLGSMLFYTE